MVFSSLRFAVVLLGLCFFACLDAPPAAFAEEPEPYAAVLERHVAKGRVDYRALKENPAQLRAYLDSLAAVDQPTFESWSEARQLAYLLNLYNAQTLQLILDHYPLRSIRDIGTIFMGPWDRSIVRLFGRSVSLDYLEHALIRRDYEDPRVHFALVCAAKGCPPLRREPYEGARLEAQLEDQARLFMSDSAKNRVDTEAGVLYLSPIFRWFKKDFLKQTETLQAYAARYLPEAGGQSVIRFTEYDWSLNDAEKSSLKA